MERSRSRSGIVGNHPLRPVAPLAGSRAPAAAVFAPRLQRISRLPSGSLRGAFGCLLFLCWLSQYGPRAARKGAPPHYLDWIQHRARATRCLAPPVSGSDPRAQPSSTASRSPPCPAGPRSRTRTVPLGRQHQLSFGTLRPAPDRPTDLSIDAPFLSLQGTEAETRQQAGLLLKNSVRRGSWASTRPELQQFIKASPQSLRLASWLSLND